MTAARFEPPNGYPCNVTVTVLDPSGGEEQRSEFTHSQLEQWAEGKDWSDEDYQARMLESMAQDRVRSSDPYAPAPIDESQPS
jgi:hypothetical protein